MGLITDRDILILKILSSGCTRFAVIKDLLDKIYKEKISESALLNRLAILRKDKCILAQRYKYRLSGKQAEKAASVGFVLNEFNKGQRGVEILCRLIRNEKYEIGPIKAAENTIEWLNEVLSLPGLFEEIITKKKIKETKAIKVLRNKTKEARKKSFDDIPSNERNSIKKLNRMLLKGAYPVETPKRKTPMSSAGQSGHKLYALAEGSVEWLAQAGYTRDKIRLGLPSPLFVTHDLMITETVRAIKRESAQMKYNFEIYDENTMKSLDLARKRRAFPDLVVIMRFIVNDDYKRRIIALEIDNDTELPSFLYTKITKHTEAIILILCPGPLRINTLQRYFAKQKSFDVEGKVFFGNVNDFSRNGFFDSELVTVTNRGADFIPPKSKLKPFTDNVIT